MPFGAQLTPHGVRFRLWAPGARSVAVELEGARGSVPMEAASEGWFEAHTREAGAGSLYRYLIDEELPVPDPASRYQAADVHGPSVVVDPGAYRWAAAGWCGRPWHEAVLYELHVGTFTPEGTFDAIRSRLDYLAGLGVTAIELMPIADFSGTRNWGYDGVLPYAPASAYGTPEALKRLVDDAHARGLMMLLDVVYNHFGPDGNYLNAYAPQFFTRRFETPWGAAIDFARREVRDFYRYNALYWLDEYRFDGLRFDAVHAIIDESEPHVLEEIADAVRERFDGEREIHLVLENEDNTTRYLERAPSARPRRYTAQWNDDIHHACHVIATGEGAAYYEDYVERPIDQLLRCLAEGFAFQGDPFRHWHGKARGEPSVHLPPTAFVSFLQNHDQIGNRAFGERLTVLAEPEVLRALAAIVLLAPSPPMLFMGEEWGAEDPFLFFCDFHDELADSVRKGRRREFAKFPEFQDESSRERIPDPNAEETYVRSMLDWNRLESERHAAWLGYYRQLLEVRHREIVPRVPGIGGAAGRTWRFGRGGLAVTWLTGEGAELALLANLCASELGDLPFVPDGRLLHGVGADVAELITRGRLPGWSAAWYLR
jgi:malto-oligosyltrehalose trehalohydrolase